MGRIVAQPRSLFDPAPIDLPWVILDGAWAGSVKELRDQLTMAGTRFLVDTGAWRFQDASAANVKKLQALEHAPKAHWGALSRDDFQRFVAADLRLQAELGASAYLVPGLVPRKGEGDLQDFDAAATAAVKDVCFQLPLPAIATIGFHTQGVTEARQRLEDLSGIYSGVYLQGTPIDPYRDGASKLTMLTSLFVEAQSLGVDVIAGRMGALGVPLRAMGVAAADAGLASGESFDVGDRLRAQRPRDKEQSGAPSTASRRYLRPLKRSHATKVLDIIESVPELSARLRCDSCCKYLTPDDRISRGREHSLVTRIVEAQEISGLPRSMRMERAERDWATARTTLTTVNTALSEAGHRPFDTDYLDNQLSVMRAVTATQQAA